MNLSQTYIQSLSSTLFWDVSIMSIDVENHIQFILERVLTRGTLEDFKKTLSFYGKEKIGKTVVKIKTLDKKTLHFCSVYFSIEKSQFICYNTKPLNHQHWDYSSKDYLKSFVLVGGTALALQLVDDAEIQPDPILFDKNIT